jgi:tRNA (guanine-N7-)-methyltransferase
MSRARRLPVELLEPYLLAVAASPPNRDTPSEATMRLDWGQVFGNANPVEVEIGFGKGLFLLTSAQAHPQTNYLGVEILRKYQLFAATRMARRGLHNVRLVCADARRFLRDYLTDACVAAVHVYFPDPWWKRRHEKRRLFTAEFAAQCARVLRPGGKLYLVTDVEEYFGMMQRLLAQQSILSKLPRTALGTPEHDLDYLTNFERKYREVGRPIYRVAYERLSGSAFSREP